MREAGVHWLLINTPINVQLSLAARVPWKVESEKGLRASQVGTDDDRAVYCSWL